MLRMLFAYNYAYRNAKDGVQIIDAYVPVFHFASRIFEGTDSVSRWRQLQRRRRRNRIQVCIVEQTQTDIVDFADNGLHQFERLIGYRRDENNKQEFMMLM